MSSIAVPTEMRSIVERVRQSQSILEAEQESEGERFPHMEATWQRATRFVMNASLEYWRIRQLAPPTPAISAGPDGSIDIVWRQDNRFIAANIPEEPVNIVTLYGRDPSRPNRRLRVEEDPEIDGSWILEWLMR